MPGLTPALDERPLRPALPGRLLMPVERRIGALAMARLYSVADQGLGGLANLVSLLLLGGVMRVEEFGALGMMIGLHYFMAGFHRSAIVLPFLTIHREAPRERAAQVEAANWWWLSLGASLALSTPLAGAALVLTLLGGRVASLSWLAHPLLLAALVTPPMLAAEFTRRWLFRIERADLVAFIALVYFAALAGSAFAVAQGQASALQAALCWAAANLLTAALALAFLRPGWHGLPALAGIAGARWREALWLASANLPYAVYGSATIVVLIGAIVGPVAAAVFTAARTLANPAMSIVSAIDSTDKPRAAKALATGGLASLGDAVARTRRLILAVTGLYLGAVALWAGPLADLVYRHQYPDLATEIRLLALAFLLAGLNQPSETFLIALRKGATMLRLRSITALLALTALALSARFGVTAMAAAVAAIHAINLAMLVATEKRVLRAGDR